MFRLARVNVGRPRIEEPLATFVDLVVDAHPGKGLLEYRCDLGCRGSKCADVIDATRQVRLLRRVEVEDAADRVRHRHERDPRVRSGKAVVGTSRCRCVEHLRDVVAGSTARDGERTDQAGEAEPTEVHAEIGPVLDQCAVVIAVVPTEMLARELVDTVHRNRHQVLILGHPSGTLLGVTVG